MKRIAVFALFACLLLTASPGLARLDVQDRGSFIRFEDKSLQSPNVIFLRKDTIIAVEYHRDGNNMKVTVTTSELKSSEGASTNKAHVFRIINWTEVKNFTEEIVGLINQRRK